jgi:hypothetical protein
MCNAEYWARECGQRLVLVSYFVHGARNALRKDKPRLRGPGSMAVSRINFPTENQSDGFGP